MRASRLLTILMILQVRGRVTAQALADECEVSLRTIYRDVDALSASGVPVYSDRGSTGGYRLLEGYRIRLNGLSPREAEAMFLSGLSGPAASLGLGAAMAAAQLKMTTALPPEMRSAADRMRARFHLDAPGWFQSAEEPEHLQSIAAAVWEERLVEIRYRSWKAESERRVAPLGIVLKSGAWYLVGSVDGSVRTYRVARIRALRRLEGGFARPAEFNLAVHWSDSIQRLETELHQGTATIRLSPTGLRMLEQFFSPFVLAGMEMGEAGADGFGIVTVPVGSVWHACSDILRFGDDAEVLGPPELRARMRATVVALQARYLAE